MSILAYNELVKLIEDGVIDAPVENVNGTTIDLTLHHIVRKEQFNPSLEKIRLYKGESIPTTRVDMTDEGEFMMMPDSILLGSSVEWFNMPLDMSAEFSLKSSCGRNFLGHELAGWVDPGFSGRLTLELKNNNQFKKLILAPNQKIGQVKFFRHEPVPLEHSYRTRGQYNNQAEATPSFGIK